MIKEPLDNRSQFLKKYYLLYSGCNCSTVGSNNPQQCERNGGQCSCKMNVIGRTCEACRPDYFNFTSGQGCIGEVAVSKIQYRAK